MNRSEEFTLIGDLMMRGGGRALLLHGMAGVGKTEMAVAYAVRRRADFDVGWWVDSTTKVTIIAGLARLAPRLGIKHVDDADAARAVVRQLSDQDRWLLIFDNAEDPSDLAELIPVAAHGTVLITSRNPRFDALAEQLMLEPFSRAHAAQFLMSRSGDHDGKSADILADEMGGLPLALEQAGAYCSDVGIGLSGYLDRYRSRRLRLLQKGTSARHVSVDATLRMSLARLTRLDRAAAELLQLMAFMAPSDVPRDLVLGSAAKLPRALSRASRDVLRVDHSVGSLRQASLLTSATPTALRVHQLVAELLRERVERGSRDIGRRLLSKMLLLSGRGGLSGWPVEHWLRCALHVLGDYGAADDRDQRSWSRAATVLPHALAVLSHLERLAIELTGVDAIIASTLLTDIGINIFRSGSHEEAEGLCRKALALAQTLPADSQARVRAANHLAQVLHGLGRLAEAESLYLELLEVLKATTDQGNMQTQEISNNLAGVYMDQEPKLEPALALMTDVLETWRNQLGEFHPLTMLGMNNTAKILRRLQRIDEAVQLSREAYDLSSYVLGAEQPDTLIPLNNLAEAYRVKGDLAEAERLHAQALETRQRTLGPGHPATMISMNNLARIRALRGDREAALTLYRRVLETVGPTLRADHPCIVNARNGIAQFGGESSGT